MTNVCQSNILIIDNLFLQLYNKKEVLKIWKQNLLKQMMRLKNWSA